MGGLASVLATAILWHGVMVYNCREEICAPFPDHPTVQWAAHPTTQTIAECLATAITQMAHMERVDAEATVEVRAESQGGPYLRTESQFQCLLDGDMPTPETGTGGAK